MTNYLEIIKPLVIERNPVKAALFDFDGTISTLRQGWEEIMEPLMIEMINAQAPDDHELVNKVRDFIDESTGIQTINQMYWLVEQVEKYERNPEVHDAWWYKDEYNRRLLEVVQRRTDKLICGGLKPKDYRIKGSYEFLKALSEKDIDIYIASGTDDIDVQREVELVGIKQFVKHVAGALPRSTDCSKEAVIKNLIENQGLLGNELVVIGDGKVEIALGIEAGAITIGAATDEMNRFGINDFKRGKLIKAGAHAIVGDFLKYEEILHWLGI
jgi:phosphoglycolate phosphatase-like HAD superfamily hydrolase